MVNIESECINVKLLFESSQACQSLFFYVQKLLETFKENHYPSRQMKESLAEELGVTVRQVYSPFIRSLRLCLNTQDLYCCDVYYADW